MDGRTPPKYRSVGFGGVLRDYREFSAGELGPLDRLAAVESPVVGIRIGPLRICFVLDAELAREVLVTDEESYKRPAFIARPFVEAMGDNLFTASGSAWRERRRLYQPSFTRRHVDMLAETMTTTIADEVERWPEDTTLDMQACLTDLTLRVAAQTLIGLDITSHEDGPALRRHFEGVISWIGHRYLHRTAAPANIPTRRNRQMTRDRVALESIVRSAVAQRRRAAHTRADILQLLLETTDEAGRPLSDEEIVGECIGFLFAGHETTAATLTWAIYELACNPEAQERVAAEGDELGSGTLDKLAYTSRVVEEALRLYPPGVAIVRSVRESTQLGGYQVRRGTVMAIILYAIHRNPRHWPDPGTFNPDRFLTDEPHASLPFGLGPRQCLGARFATTEARLALATIASRWRLSLMRPVKPKPRIELALRVDGGLPMQLRRRHPAHLGP